MATPKVVPRGGRPYSWLYLDTECEKNGERKVLDHNLYLDKDKPISGSHISHSPPVNTVVRRPARGNFVMSDIMSDVEGVA